MLENETGKLGLPAEPNWRTNKRMTPFVTIQTEYGPVEFFLTQDKKYLTLSARNAVTGKEVFLPDQHKVSSSPRFRRKKRFANPQGEYYFFIEDIVRWFKQATIGGELSILGPSQDRHQPAQSISKPIVQQSRIHNSDVTAALELDPDDWPYHSINPTTEQPTDDPPAKPETE